MNEINLKAYAKINLFLEVLNKREDGYHNIETIFQSIDLCDIITVRIADRLVIKCTDPGVPSDETNLSYRAWKVLTDEVKEAMGAEIDIVKGIPVGGGLAGGSADAAATLFALNELWDLGLSSERLMELGSKIGADVPFCLLGGTALGRGKGEILTKLPFIGELHLVLANPGFQISTAIVYKAFDEANLGLTRQLKSANIFIRNLCGADKGSTSLRIEPFNALESVVMEKHPEVRRLKELFLEFGALQASMTGSGPTVFAIARDLDHAKELYEKVRSKVIYCRIAKTCPVSLSII